MNCSNCNARFDPVRCHWRCPYCGYREHCCDGAPRWAKVTVALLTVAALLVLTEPPDVNCIIRSLPYHCDPPPK